MKKIIWGVIGLCFVFGLSVYAMGRSNEECAMVGRMSGSKKSNMMENMSMMKQCKGMNNYKSMMSKLDQMMAQCEKMMEKRENMLSQATGGDEGKGSSTGR